VFATRKSVRFRLLFVLILSFLSLPSFAEPEVEDSPFSFACKTGVDETLIPETGFFNLHIPKVNNADGTNAYQLASLVADRVALKIDNSKNLTNNILTCMDMKEPNMPCKELLAWVDIEIPKYVKEARFHLLLSQGTHDLDTFFVEANSELNEDMSNWAIYKDIDWDEPTLNERITAQGVLDQYKRAVKDMDEDQANMILMALRAKHFDQYKSMFAVLNLLQYLHSSSPDRREVREALMDLRDTLEVEERRLSQLVAMTEKSRWRYFDRKKATDPVGRRRQGRVQNRPSNDFMELFDYTSILEDILILNPQFCPLAIAVIEQRGNHELRETLAIGLPLLASSFFVPPLAGIAIGVAAGSGITYHTHTKLQGEIGRNLGHVYGDDTGIGLEKMNALKRQRNVELAILPIGLGLGTALTSKLTSVAMKSFDARAMVSMRQALVKFSK
jgi:hypothetical protein